MDLEMIPLYVGMFLIAVGVLQVFVQMLRTPRDRQPQIPTQSIHATPSGVRVGSAYPGMAMIAIGALLIAFGAALKAGVFG